MTPDDGKSLIAEEMRMVKRPILRHAFGKAANSPELHSNLVMVTSAMPGEGKSFTSLNLAMSIAMELDRTALLVDADVARPSIGRYLGVSPRKGLVDYLLNEDVDLADVMQKTNVPKLTVLPAGRDYHYSTELLASEAMSRLMRELSLRYPDRVVIFDSPPVLVTSEARVLAEHMGQILLVVEYGKTQNSLVQEALSSINPKPEQSVGMVLNKRRNGGGEGYYGAYGGYGAQ